ncbi:MAG: hypothetical protein ACTSW2_03190 [Alphaproteobacteria bacterium]
MSHFRLLLAAASALALAACAPTGKSRIAAPLPPTTTDSAVSAQSAATDIGANTGGTYPYGNAGGVQTSNAGAGQNARTSTGPDGAIWLKPDTPNARYRTDADNCYSYARAQTNHDARIESDSVAAFQDTTGGIGVIELQQRMNQFARKNRMPRLFGKCMEAKGYTRG